MGRFLGAREIVLKGAAMSRNGLFGLLRFALAAALILVCGPALAEKRVALVLGDSAYQHAPSLTNPANDAALIAKTLKDAGFDVVDSRQNLSAQETRRALREFSDEAADADIAVVYFAGHGLELDGVNYLIPVDARLQRDGDVYDEAISLDRLLVAVEPAKKLRLVILDACRDNPFLQTMKRTLSSRSISRGLAKIETDSPNTLIAYSAKAGSTALDGTGKDSPFTVALASHLTTPGLDVRRALGFVRDDVLKSTANRQEPYVYGSLGGDDVPLVPAPAPAPAASAAPSGDAQTNERRDYELALQIGNRAAFEAFLAQHGDGYYANLAKLQLDKLSTAEAHAAPSAPAAPSPAAAAPAAPPPAAATPDKPATVASLDAAASQPDLTKSVQTELRRVGCYSGNPDGDWNAASKRSLSQFNRNAGTNLDVKAASADTLDAIKQKSSRVCPLTCEHGFKADGDHCTRIVCAEGSFVNDNNECEKRHAKTVKRDDEDRRDRRVRQDRQDRQDRQQSADRGRPRYDFGYGAPPSSRQQERPLTGLERERGCNTNEAIMSGRCP
jgi:hypothetical protein